MHPRIYTYIFLLSFIIFNFFQLQPVTLVYNMRVRRAFNVPEFIKQKKARYLISMLPIAFARKSCILQNDGLPVIAEKRRVGGSLFNLRYIPSKNWWLDVTTGIERDSAQLRGTLNSSDFRTGFDDIVLTGGYRHFYKKHMQFIGYGLVGLPARRKVELSDHFGPLVGTRFFNVGVGVEASYSFISELKKSFSIIGQGRFVHGFKRSWFPILPKKAIIDPGNFSDVLCALQYRNRLTVYQAGYDLTIFSDQAVISPTVIIKSNTSTRSSWYATIGQGILNGFFEKPTLFGAGFSMSKAKVFDARSVVGWIFLTQVF